MPKNPTPDHQIELLLDPEQIKTILAALHAAHVQGEDDAPMDVYNALTGAQFAAKPDDKPSADLIVEMHKQHVARQIGINLAGLDRALSETIGRAQEARDAIKNGRRVGTSISVLSTSPRDVEAYAVAVQALLEVAASIMTPDEIVAAYKPSRY